MIKMLLLDYIFILRALSMQLCRWIAHFLPLEAPKLNYNQVELFIMAPEAIRLTKTIRKSLLLKLKSLY